MGPEAAIQMARPVGKTGAQHVNRVNRGFFSEGRQGMAPGKRVAEQTVNQHQRRAAAGAQIAHAAAVEQSPAFLGCSRQHGSLKCGRERPARAGSSRDHLFIHRHQFLVYSSRFPVLGLGRFPHERDARAHILPTGRHRKNIDSGSIRPA